MKLMHPEWTHGIEFQENKVQILVVEHPHLFYEYVQDLYRQCENGQEGKFVLSEEDKILMCSKYAYLWVNPFENNINSKKILNKLYTELKEVAYDENHFQETNQILSDVEKYCARLIDSVDYNVVYSDQLEIGGIIKVADYKMDIESEGLLEQILNYMEVAQKLLGLHLIIFVNLKSYLTEQEFVKLYEMMKYRKFYILLVENSCPETLLEDEKQYIIDKDGCEIY